MCLIMNVCVQKKQTRVLFTLTTILKNAKRRRAPLGPRREADYVNIVRQRTLRGSGTSF